MHYKLHEDIFTFAHWLPGYVVIDEGVLTLYGSEKVVGHADKPLLEIILDRHHRASIIFTLNEAHAEYNDFVHYYTIIRHETFAGLTDQVKIGFLALDSAELLVKCVEDIVMLDKPQTDEQATILHHVHTEA